MYIEVTKETFNKIFDNNHYFIITEELENAKKHYYDNIKLEQKGIIVCNFTSSKTIVQYYLTDINA